MENERFVVIHGHFYQPPRENPWLDIIEKQPSAAPFHDWNERITAECYMPNTVSRILDPSGMIDAIVNNFEYINFDVGPTLFAWLEKHAPKTHRRIIDADRRSRDRNLGHGNAIAQAFSHMIMPLANDDDLETQVTWGIRDFIKRFEREPEGMWLPETAVNNRVMAALQRNGIKFTILAPSQALATRPLGEDSWSECANGGIDTRRPYRYFVKDETGQTIPQRYVDVFFFNEHLSRAMSFEHLMTDASRFADALATAAGNDDETHFVNVATDGETFGHHEPFADMCLASFFDREGPARGLKSINYAHYLEIAPPTVEVDIKPGPNGEGTAWSCSHGTGRWQRDCGCSTGGPGWWHQRWRKPLRDAFDNLRADLDEVFMSEGSGIFRDPIAARNDYIDVVLDRREETIDAFLKKHAAGKLKYEDRVKALKLMESQRNAMYMYTSCGWFFAELSGIETVQNMRYAAQAVEMAEEYTDKPLMANLLSDLAAAPSNIPEMGNGRKIFRRLVWPSMMTMEKIVAASAMSVLLTDKPHTWRPLNHTVEDLSTESLPDKYHSHFGMARCTSRLTAESDLFSYHVTQFTARDVRCYIRKIADEAEHNMLRERLIVAQKASLPEIFEGRFISWGDLLPEVASHIMSVLVDNDLEKLRAHFTELFEQNLDLFQALVTAGNELPYEVQGLVKYALSRLFHNEVLSRRNDWHIEHFARATEYVETASRLGVEIDTKDVDALVTEDLLAEAEAIKGDLGPRHFQNAISILEVGNRLGLSLRRDLAENIILEVLEDKVMPWIHSLTDPVRDREDYEAILGVLDLAEKLNFSSRRYKEALRDFAKKIESA